MSVRPGAAGLCHVLREDPELAEAIPSARRGLAIEECTARELHVSCLSQPGSGLPPLPDGLGLLMLEGLLIRRVGVEGRFCSELLGAGDVLRPWQDAGHSPMLPLNTSWSVIEQARLALLDAEFLQRLSSYPELAAALVARAIQRSRNLAVNMAIVHQPRVDIRLQMLLWHLAGRWGRVSPGGITLPMRLTHTLLADLVAARRPTVTTALSDLARRGLISFHEDRWLLSGEAPAELLDLVPIGVEQAIEASLLPSGC